MLQFTWNLPFDCSWLILWSSYCVFFPSVPSLSSPLSALSIFCPSPVTLCHPLAKLGAKPGCKSLPTGLECRGSGGPWLNWHMHHRVWGMTPLCQTLDPSNITNFTERRKLVMGDTFGTLKGDFLPPTNFVPDLAECGTCHIASRLFLIIAAPSQRSVISFPYEQMVFLLHIKPVLESLS